MASLKGETITSVVLSGVGGKSMFPDTKEVAMLTRLEILSYLH